MKVCFDSQARHRITEANINYYSAPFTHPARKMREHDFIYMLDGEWKFGQNNEIYTLKKDHLLILSANYRHYGVSPCRTNTKTMYFHVSAEPGDRFFETEGAGEDLLDALMDVSFNRNIKKIFYEIVTAKLSGNERKAGILFELLISELLDVKQYTNGAAVGGKIKDVIHQNPERFFSNHELAGMTGVSLKSAEAKFKAQFGVTIHQYMLRFKIEQALNYWKEFPEMSVKEVAYNLGFYDEYHFSRQFKKTVGISPLQYKQQQFISD